jgi:putative flippase GtrA
VREVGRLLLFVAAGGVNTLFGYAAFALLFHIGLPVPAAITLGTIAGILFNFASISRVFGSRDARRLARFLLVYAVLLVANLALLPVLTGAGVPTLLGQVGVTLLLAPCSFLAMRRLVFFPSPSPEIRA